MKIQQSTQLSAFGGINFVIEHLESLNIGKYVDTHLPDLANQSKYKWSDAFYSLASIYMSGGDSIEDLKTYLKPHLDGNPFFKIPSPDTVLKRMKSLSTQNQQATTERGSVVHTYNANKDLCRLNARILKTLGIFKAKELVMDYDNTIIFNEKQDSSMTYKRNKGYQPGVCTINESTIFYIENRGGNSDAKSFQDQSLQRIFTAFGEQTKRQPDHFRADAASYQYKVISLLEQKVKNFYIGTRNSYVEKYYSKIQSWEKITDSTGEIMEIGEISFKPFQKRSKETIKEYRLVVKRKANKTGQLNAFTNDNYDYKSIITNNFEWTATKIALFYNHRGNMERQFDILKNDFGWNNMPFSKINQNTVFLYFTAMIRNLYNVIIEHFSKIVHGLKPTYRLKKFIFRFIILPSKWVYRSRQKILKLYGNINWVT